MKLEEAIERAEELAESYEAVINTGRFEDGTYVSELYADDTECIEEHLARYDKCANEHRQLVEWLKDYKRLLEQEPKTGHWINNHNGTFECDECGCKHGRSKWCPDCGAKMQEL